MQIKRKRFKILSIDGGGVRGIIPSVFLSKLQDLTGKHPTELFDLMIGTSTGSIIVAVLSTPDEHGKPKYNTQHLLDVYLNECPKVFSRSMWKNVTSVYGIYGGRFSTKMRDELFQQWLGNVEIKDTINDIVIPTFDMCEKQPAFFKSRKGKENPQDNVILQEAVKAALAAPTIFPAHKLGERLYIDALYGKNPTMFAIIEALKHYDVQLEDIDILSLGTGYTEDGNAESIEKTVQSGVPFLIEVFNSTINGNTISTQYMAEQILPLKDSQCLRLDILLESAHMGICDVSPQNLSYLEKAAKDYLETNFERFTNFVSRLIDVEPSRFSLPPLPDDVPGDFPENDTSSSSPTDSSSSPSNVV